MGVLCLVLVLLFSALCPPSFSIILMGKRERTGCLTLIVFLMSCDLCVLWLLLMVSWAGPDHTHLLYWGSEKQFRFSKNLKDRCLLYEI